MRQIVPSTTLRPKKFFSDRVLNTEFLLKLQNKQLDPVPERKYENLGLLMR